MAINFKHNNKAQECTDASILQRDIVAGSISWLTQNMVFILNASFLVLMILQKQEIAVIKG